MRAGTGKVAIILTGRSKRRSGNQCSSRFMILSNVMRAMPIRTDYREVYSLSVEYGVRCLNIL